MKRTTRALTAIFMIAVMVLTMTVGQSAFAASKVGKVKGIKATTSVKKKTIKLSWKKVKGASGYSIQKNTKKKFKKIKAVTVKKRQKTFKKLKVGKTYYFRLRAFKKTKSGKKYGKATIKKVRLERSVEIIETTPKATYATIGHHHPTEVPRTTDADGNPTPAFISSCKGFTLKIVYPWDDDAREHYYADGADGVTESLYGVNIEQSGFYEGYDTALSASLAAGAPQAHIYHVKSSSVADYLDKNYFCDLTAGMKKAGVDLKEPWYDTSATNFLNINNKQVAWSLIDHNPYMIYYVKGHVMRAGLTDPNELARSGKWTWDVLEEYVEKAQGYGLLVDQNNPTVLLNGMIASFGKSTTKVESGAAPTVNFDDSTVRHCLDQLYDWGTLAYYPSGTWATPREEFGKGEHAFIYGSQDLLLSVDSKIKLDIGIVPFPKPTQEQTTYYNYNRLDYVQFIPVQYKNDAAKILFIYNELQRKQYFYYAQWEVDYKNSFGFEREDEYLQRKAYFSLGNFRVANDWSVFNDPMSTSVNDMIRKIESYSNYTVQQGVDEYSDDIALSYAETWGNNKTTGNF